ncbi:33131_t:CDS:2, partial [Gigaspora margarita]
MIDRSSDPQRIYKDQIIESLANYHNIKMEQELENYHISNDEDKDSLITIRGLKTVKVLLRLKQKSKRMATFDDANRRLPSKGILLCVKNKEVNNLAEALIKLSIDGQWFHIKHLQ